MSALTEIEASLVARIQRAMREAHERGECVDDCVFCCQTDMEARIANNPLVALLRKGKAALPVTLK